MLRIAMVSILGLSAAGQSFVNTAGMKMVRVEAGRFRMGESAVVLDDLLDPLTYPTRSELVKRFPQVEPAKFRIPFEARRHGDYDETPVREVKISKAFHVSAHEVTNAQYEQFDAGHKALRGKFGFSKADYEAVVFVSWAEAKAYCEWLSKKEGKRYRLPTEAEWEYAARAGSATLYFTGDHLPAEYLKNQRATGYRAAEDKVPLTVGRTPANAWGLFDVHGNVEEWVEDWYGPYQAGAQTDPFGPADGDFKVTRGGSHGTAAYYLRSANRSGAPPETRNWLIGFRVVADGVQLPVRRAAEVKEARGVQSLAPPVAGPYFRGPRQFVKIAPNSHGPVYSHHNHDMAIAECPNGDLLAIWYTCEQERGREVAVASARLRKGAEEWETAEPFWDTPDRNDHCPALWFDGKETLYHFNGLGAATLWEPLAIVMRTSKDSGRTWSKARFVTPEFGFRNMVGEPVIRTRDGAILFGADAAGGSTVWVSRDEGQSWSEQGGHIRGVHAGIVQLQDRRLMALGRGQDMDAWMPKSFSDDMGKSWTYEASGMPPIGGGQRLVLMRLKEGPLLFVGFAENPFQFAKLKDATEARGRMNLFAALSYDEGKTWPVRRVITDGGPEHAAQTIDGGRIRMSEATSEMQGYLAATQARNGMVHLISSWNHYAFNKAWLEQPQKPVSRAPKVQEAPELRLSVEVEADGPGTVDLWEPNGALVTQHYRVLVEKGQWRIAVRKDTAVQVYREGKLVSVGEPETVIDWRLPARGRHLEWSGGVRKAVAHE
ncbi:MAG: SUMF1/EgtB/PvdO family nonheme iron enzyme [Acidobacteria bacterium]|nr:SUMF1/EgtB/PvdO family nonheme iron enzyme [Acidobacteriota bacterium]